MATDPMTTAAADHSTGERVLRFSTLDPRMRYIFEVSAGIALVCMPTNTNEDIPERFRVTSRRFGTIAASGNASGMMVDATSRKYYRLVASFLRHVLHSHDVFLMSLVDVPEVQHMRDILFPLTQDAPCVVAVVHTPGRGYGTDPFCLPRYVTGGPVGAEATTGLVATKYWTDRLVAAISLMTPGKLAIIDGQHFCSDIGIGDNYRFDVIRPAIEHVRAVNELVVSHELRTALISGKTRAMFLGEEYARQLLHSRVRKQKDPSEISGLRRKVARLEKTIEIGQKAAANDRSSFIARIVEFERVIAEKDAVIAEKDAVLDTITHGDGTTIDVFGVMKRIKCLEAELRRTTAKVDEYAAYAEELNADMTELDTKLTEARKRHAETLRDIAADILVKIGDVDSAVGKETRAASALARLSAYHSD